MLGNYPDNQKVGLVKRVSLDLFFTVLGGGETVGCVYVSVIGIIKNISYKTVS